MRIGVAQIKAERGDIGKNIVKHKRFIESAIEMDIDMIIFPELSLTGYEPDLAMHLALNQHDEELTVFQKLSNSYNITIGVGAPTKTKEKVHISMFLFQPNSHCLIYSKQYLHPSEAGIFEPLKNDIAINYKGHTISFAICYELSIPEHSLAANSKGSDIYIASVLNPVNGVDNDILRLSEIAKKYKMTVLMSNYVGVSGGYNCGGKSTILNKEGSIVGQLDSSNQGFVAIDTNTGNVFSQYFNE